MPESTVVPAKEIKAAPVLQQLDWPKYRFLVLLILLVIGGVVLSIFGSKYWGHAAQGIGDALIIAGVLGLTVDGYMKSHLLKEVSRDLSHYLLGYHLPDEIQHAIKQLMFTEQIRRDLHLYYKLSLPPGVSNKVLVELTLTYSIENLTYRDIDYTQYFYQEALYSPRFTELTCNSSQLAANYHLTEEELIKQVEHQQDAFVIKVEGRKLKIPARNADHGASYEFTAKCISLYPQDFGDPFTFDFPCLGAFIKAEYPPTFVFDGPAKPDLPNRWIYPHRLFFGGEKINMRWRKKGPEKSSKRGGMSASAS